MKKYGLSFILFSLLCKTLIVSASPARINTIAQPISCISSQFTLTGDQWSSEVTLKLTNNCPAPVDFENTTITFKNRTALNTNFWGYFTPPLPYPDTEPPLIISSQVQPDSTYLATLNMHFTVYQGVTTKLPVGSSIRIVYVVEKDTHIDGTVNVYAGGSSVNTGSLQLRNVSAKPNGVTQNYALVHLTMNGSKVSDIQLPWNTTVTVPNLMPGTYNLAAENVMDGAGSTYQSSINPSVVTVIANQQVFSTINYSLVQQGAKINISVQNLPAELSGFNQKPLVLLRENQTGASLSQLVDWNSTTTVSQLKSGSTYIFSSSTLNYNGYSCTPSFNPQSLVAANPPTITNLTYQCVQVAQDTVSLKVNGGPTNLASLKITLMPNDNTATKTSVVNLNNGSGSNTILLTHGVIYTLSADPVSGYNIKFSPQPLTAAPNAKVTITLSPQTSGTPLAVNGQLTVCGTQLCNEHGNPIQLKGMSSHGLQWYSQCLTSAALDALTNSFKSNVIRIALYVQEGGYETNPAQFTARVSDLINEAYNRGIYVIVDWHILNPGNPNDNLTLAKKFFSDIATAHKNKNNILYEIANEPNGVSWATIKSYADQIIPVIRAIDSKAPILIGTRAWSSLGISEGSSYQEIVNNPITFPNIMYTFHFYAASHRDEYLTALRNASAVLPIFVSEFGLQTFTGDGPNDFTMSDAYLQLMADKKIGWTNWNHSDDFRSGAIWKEDTCSMNVWTDDRLKPSGLYIKGKIQN